LIVLSFPFGGLSITIMLVERGGRPIHTADGKPQVTPENPNADYAGQIGWSASNTFAWAINGHRVGVIQNNASGIYSTHVGGANVALADGSVSYLSDSTAFSTLTRLFGGSDGER
jgi:prepilin-type processing-associated H-X9-DG protein